VKVTISNDSNSIQLQLENDKNMLLEVLCNSVKDIFRQKDAVYLMTNDNEILAPNCKIVELVILNPKKYRTLKVVKNFEGIGIKSNTYESRDVYSPGKTYNYKEKEFKEYKPPTGELKDFKNEKDYKPVELKDYKNTEKDYKTNEKDFINTEKDHKVMEKDFKPVGDFKEYKPLGDYKSGDYKDFNKPVTATKKYDDYTDYSYKKDYTYDKEKKPDEKKEEQADNDLLIKSEEQGYQKYYEKYQKDTTINPTTSLAFNYKKPDINYSYSNNISNLEQNNFISITDNLNLDRTSDRVKSPNPYGSTNTGTSGTQPFNYTERINNDFSNNRQRFASEKRGYPRDTTKPEDPRRFNPDPINSDRNTEKSIGYSKPVEKKVIYL
jgi:hypothetical protein